MQIGCEIRIDAGLRKFFQATFFQTARMIPAKQYGLQRISARIRTTVPV